VRQLGLKPLADARPKSKSHYLKGRDDYDNGVRVDTFDDVFCSSASLEPAQNGCGEMIYIPRILALAHMRALSFPRSFTRRSFSPHHDSSI